MSGISLILLVTFLCLVVRTSFKSTFKNRLRFCILTFLKKIPGFIYRPEIEDEDEEERKRFDRHYVRVWRAAMWVFLISRMLQPIIMVISDKELRLKTKVFLGLVVEERRIGTTGNLTNKAKA